MKRMILCQANGDQSRWDELNAELRAMGYPLDPSERITQITCSNDVLELGSDRIERIKNQVHNAPPGPIFFDNEYEGHAAYRRPNSPAQWAVRDHLMEFAHARGRVAGFWGEPSVWSHSDEPISSIGISNANRHRVHADLVIGNAYLREHLNTPARAARYAINVHYWTHIARRGLHGSPRLFVAMQPCVRPSNRDRIDMQHNDAYVLGRTLASVDAATLLWFEQAPTLETTLERARGMADSFMDGWDSIGMYVPRKASH